MKQRAHIAVRTCVGCRSTDAQAQLLRVVAAEVDGARRAVADVRRRRPGRGAWLHRRPECLAQAARGLARALRMPVPARDLQEIVRLASARPDDISSQTRPDVASGPPGVDPGHEHTKA